MKISNSGWLFGPPVYVCKRNNCLATELHEFKPKTDKQKAENLVYYVDISVSGRILCQLKIRVEIVRKVWAIR